MNREGEGTKECHARVSCVDFEDEAGIGIEKLMEMNSVSPEAEKPGEIKGPGMCVLQEPD